jgi:hypothetical protein
MKPFISIVKSEGAVVTKYQDFDTEAEAIAHTSNSSGEFVAPNPGGGTNYWVVDAEAETVTNNQDQADADALANSWASLRTERNALLVSSDWTQASDSPLTDEVKATWATYRGELRDFPESADPANPTWPTPPE